MKQKSLKKNLMYNLIYQILAIIMPLITTPYIARVIGPTGSGTYSYTYSIANYFVIFAMLGISTYGSRLIAQNRDDRDKLSKEFTSLFILHIIISLTCLLFYLIFSIFIVNNYEVYFLLQAIFVISAVFDINWLFFGLEEFKTTVTRNIIIKIISVICIFTFIKTSDDLIKYILILNGSTLLSQLVLFPFLKKNNIKFVKINKKDIIKHLKPMFVLFIPIIALSVYKMMDKIMLGKMINVTEVGLYEYGERIINLPMALITTLGTVMLPRMSNLISKGDEEAVKRYIDKSMKFVLFLSIPLSVGLIMISKDFIPFFLGDKYTGTIILVQLLAITVPIISFANVIRTQYLIPKKMDKEFVISIILGAVVNFILNYLLIKEYQAFGACIATIVAEFVVMFYQLITVIKLLPIKKYLTYILEFLIKSLIMALLIYSINWFNIDNIALKIIISISIGMLVYFVISIRYINEIINFKKFIIRGR